MSQQWKIRPVCRRATVSTHYTKTPGGFIDVAPGYPPTATGRGYKRNITVEDSIKPPGQPTQPFVPIIPDRKNLYWKIGYQSHRYNTH